MSIFLAYNLFLKYELNKNTFGSKPQRGPAKHSIRNDLGIKWTNFKYDRKIGRRPFGNSKVQKFLLKKNESWIKLLMPNGLSKT